jgi:hypothetical protein
MTLGVDLERDRLTQRAQRVRAVIAALQRQTGGGGRAAARASNRYLFQAISDFQAELAAIDARLSDLVEVAAPAQRPKALPPDSPTP